MAYDFISFTKGGERILIWNDMEMRSVREVRVDKTEQQILSRLRQAGLKVPAAWSRPA